MGEYIKERRLALSMSQEDLAESAGTSAAYLSQIERGKVALPGADLRRRLARVLGVRHIDLIVAAGELAPDEVPGPSLPARNPSSLVPPAVFAIAHLHPRSISSSSTPRRQFRAWKGMISFLSGFSSTRGMPYSGT